MKFSKADRQGAIRILSIEASTPLWTGWPHIIASEIGVSRRAAQLAIKAWLATPIDSENAYAEAEAMVRTGWRPEHV